MENTDKGNGENRGDLRIDLSGSKDIHTENWQAENVDVILSGDGEVKLL